MSMPNFPALHGPESAWVRCAFYAEMAMLRTSTCGISGNLHRGNVRPALVAQSRSSQSRRIQSRRTQTSGGTAENIALAICSAVVGAGIKAAVDHYMTTDKKVEDVKTFLHKLDKETALDIKDLKGTMEAQSKDIKGAMEAQSKDIKLLISSVDGVKAQMKPWWSMR